MDNLIKEWENEPDSFEWIYKGYRCLILRNLVGALCGYVAVTNKHSLYNVEYNRPRAYRIDVHGGLTFSRFASNNARMREFDEFGNKLWWIGFDAAHWGDLLPDMYEKMIRIGREVDHMSDDIYRNMAYMRKETEGIVDQIKDLTIGKLRYQKKCRNRRRLHDTKCTKAK